MINVKINVEYEEMSSVFLAVTLVSVISSIATKKFDTFSEVIKTTWKRNRNPNNFLLNLLLQLSVQHLNNNDQ